MFVAMTSGMIAQAPLAYFVDEFGWRSSLFCLVVWDLVCCAGFWSGAERAS